MNVIPSNSWKLYLKMFIKYDVYWGEVILSLSHTVACYYFTQLHGS